MVCPCPKISLISLVSEIMCVEKNDYYLMNGSLERILRKKEKATNRGIS